VGWLEVDGVWELWSDGRAIASIDGARRITLWPHLGLNPIWAKSASIEEGKRHVLRWLAGNARAAGLLEDDQEEGNGSEA
jgi:hypothetical protein